MNRILAKISFFSKEKSLIANMFFAFFSFLVIYGLFFSFLSKGIGNFWDWSLPQFREHFQNIAINFSWQDLGLGSPVSYASNFYFGHLLSYTYYFKLSPETIIYLLISISAAFSSYFAYLILKQSMNRYLAWFCALIVVLNPAYFYKLLAGHVAYTVALPIFVCLIYFVLYKYQGSFRDKMLLGILISSAATQIQFFIFSLIFLAIYLIFHKAKFSFKDIIVVFLIIFLECLPWLSNFIFGANFVTSASQSATQMSFDASSHAGLMRIFAFAFSSATNIQYVYDKKILVYFGILTLAICISASYYYSFARRYINRIKIFSLVGSGVKGSTCSEAGKIDVLFVCLLVFTILGTGFYQTIPIPVLRTFYPMLRESGHFAPIIILFALLFLGSVLPQIHTKKFSSNFISVFILAYFLGFAGVNGYYFVRYLPSMDFAQARTKLQPFQNFNESNQGKGRVLTYPFWNQYGFIEVADKEKNGKLLNNSGWDTFIENSGQEHISNYAPGGHSVKDSLQYRLLKTYDITELKLKNVRYIYDLSGVYTSNFERYTPEETYDSDLSLIKNDPFFIKKLIAANPGQIVKVADNIYEIKDTMPRISISSDQKSEEAHTSLFFQKIDPTKYNLTIKNLDTKADLRFLQSYHSGWKIYLGGARSDLSNCKQSGQFLNYNAIECHNIKITNKLDNLGFLFAGPLFESSHVGEYGYANKWTLDKATIFESSEQTKQPITQNSDGSIDVNLTVFFKPETYFSISVLISLISILSMVIYTLWIRRKTKRKHEQI